MSVLLRVFAICALLLSLPAVTATAENDAVAAGLEAEARGQWDRAAAHFRAALAADAANAPATRGLARFVLLKSRRALYDDLVQRLQSCVDAHPDDWEARLLLGRLTYRRGEDPKGIYAALQARLDAHLAENPKSADGMQWKGRLAFTRGLHELAGRREAAARGLFGRAQGVLYAATRADPESFTAWYWLGMVSHYQSDMQAALDGYRKAAGLRPDNVLPLQGIQRILVRDPARYEKLLATLLVDHPEHPQVLYALGLRQLEKEAFEDAVLSLTKAAAADPGNADAHFRRGLALAQLDEEAEVLASFERALRADPHHEDAADAWGQVLFDRGLQAARRAPEDALAVVKAYEPLLALTAANPYPRKSLAYLLHTAWTSHEADPAWLPVLRASAEWYAACAPLVERWMAAGGGHLPAEQELALAQILLDAGGLYEADTPIRDAGKAEAHYHQALEISEHGFMEAWARLARMYRAEERWVDLAKLAKACSLGLDFDDGSPNETARENAMKVLDDLDRKALGAEGLFAVGRYLEQMADAERAVQFLEDALEAEGVGVERKTDILPYLGRAQRDCGAYSAAMESFRALEVLAGKDTADGIAAAYEQALCLARLGRKAEALERLQALLDAPQAPAPLKLRCRLERALLSVELGQAAAAREQLLALTRELADDGSDLGKQLRKRAMAALDALDEN